MKREHARKAIFAGIFSCCALAAGACGPSGAAVQTQTPVAPVAADAGPEPAPDVATAPQAKGIPDGNMPRAEIPDRFKWKLEPLFASDAAFAEGLAQAAKNRAKLDGYKGKLKKPQALRECLELYFETRLLTNKATLYSANKLDTDQTSSALQGMADRALDAMSGLIATAGFIRKEILALDDGALRRAYAADARLAELRPYIDEIRRRRARALGEEAERVLALAGDNLWAEIDLNELPSDHEKTFTNILADMPLPKVADAAGVEVQLTMSSYGKLRSDPERRVRRDTVEALFSTLRQYQHAYASTLSGQVRLNVTMARARGYDTARQAYMDKDDIDEEVYDNLVATVNANLEPLHRYVRLRKRIMGVDELHIYDMYTPMVAAVPMRFTYEDAARILPEALSPLGPGYVQALSEGLDVDNGWIDLYPHKGKKSGAFSCSVFGMHPFVKMNYYEEYDDLSTLAHELGHAMHSRLAMSTQPYVTSGYSAFLAEIASTTNEKLLSDYLLERAKTDEERLYLLNEMVDGIRTTIYRQALFAEFERAAHAAAERGEPLTAELLSRTYGGLIRTYYGPDFTMGENDDVEWAYIPHFYYKYYVYSYATGLSSGIAIAGKVKGEGAPAREAYLGMLKGGMSKPPLELLRGAGVDLTRPDAIAAAAKLMDDMLGQMERLIAGSRPSGAP
ncbi:MAG: oligoendopeptidase F [Proteobacteria bacterium]|jgi:oligoendopeptidase F|nr:oligoendopeptidase F [Pseudomonadota bacterium]